LFQFIDKHRLKASTRFIRIAKSWIVLGPEKSWISNEVGAAGARPKLAIKMHDFQIELL